MRAAAPSTARTAVPLARVVIGSRRSRLARRQARLVGMAIASAWPTVEVAYQQLKTRGDQLLDRPLPELGGKGLFTAALERALRRGEVDLAVHSLKDLPTGPSQGLALVAIPERGDVRDVLVGPVGGTLQTLGRGAVVGTSSLRRAALLLRARPDCRTTSVRGNVETRLEKLRNGHCNALVLAAAGLERLGLLAAKMQAGEAGFLDPDSWLPAPGQGALAVQGRADNEAIHALVAPIDDSPTRAAVHAERAFLSALGGGCRVPIGAWARASGEELVLRGIVLSANGAVALEGEAHGTLGSPGQAGHKLARQLLRKGAGRLLQEDVG